MGDKIDIKLVGVGDGAVGKTCIFIRFDSYLKVILLMSFQQNMCQQFLITTQLQFKWTIKLFLCHFGILLAKKNIID